jgi:hypothetical protein
MITCLKQLHAKSRFYVLHSTLFCAKRLILLTFGKNNIPHVTAEGNFCYSLQTGLGGMVRGKDERIFTV